MTHARRISSARTKARIRIDFDSRDAGARLKDRRTGGMVVVDYLYDLFAASPLELFSRISVLSVLEHVRKDRELFPPLLPITLPADSRAGRHPAR